MKRLICFFIGHKSDNRSEFDITGPWNGDPINIRFITRVEGSRCKRCGERYDLKVISMSMKTGEPE